MTLLVPTRRLLLTGGAALLACPAWAAAPPSGRLSFDIWRKGEKVGEHAMKFTGSGGDVSVSTDVDMAFTVAVLKIRYAHQARERWSGGAFQVLDTDTTTNSKREKVTARRSGEMVTVETLAGRRAMGGAAAPLTHWNPLAFDGPLFNPQNGKPLKVVATRAARTWTLRGDAQIEDRYDEAGVWQALKGKLPDGSTMEYRRI